MISAVAHSYTILLSAGEDNPETALTLNPEPYHTTSGLSLRSPTVGSAVPGRSQYEYYWRLARKKKGPI